ncbi:uncharacterized protein Nmag_2001 [Natrialba magadii ATCC 43099]|uniref:Uncharacterized protein n=1 Tax=Natrialba magadii (strain ATCC 43099 / DSM 3394 / CCM 3739 / CIP 104546 / IAM 13178 / JCM 8861 / NBRC 102185 / NCIMB 2190 / MS3) TaxID=547559 RepID=D3SVG4_NATMM|nr:hypothetical protein [Natrialba magadii]ADD05572.1 uncharacterized protein Nmag_2001 [Natrialba magadii ATCC 43099]ELY30013.1 hypothetical protein C500_10394 [Natrialba magadii ATCC 43099]
MSRDHHPIPWEQLPPEWGPSEYDDGHFAYRHNQSPTVLVANRTPAGDSHPGFGLCCYWELRYRYSLGDRSLSEAITRVSTRSAAVEGLLECMHRVHDSVDQPADPIEVVDALRGVSVSDLVPERRFSRR